MKMNKVEKVNIDDEMKEAFKLSSLNTVGQHNHSKQIKNNTFLNIYKYIDLPEFINSTFGTVNVDMKDTIHPKQTIDNYYDHYNICMKVNNDLERLGIFDDIDFYSEVEPRRIDIIHILALKYEDYFRKPELNSILRVMYLDILLYA